MFKCCIVTTLFILLTPAVHFSDVIHVPADQPTIQAGIDAASTGDVILVADGTYRGGGNRDLDLGGLEITVISAGGPGVCIIDCEGTNDENHRAFIFENGEGRGAVVQGFTITNGWSYPGGGIFCSGGSSPTIRYNVFINNAAYCDICLDVSHGGGIAILESSPVVENNLITGCISKDDGGGIYCRNNAFPDIRRNLITDNSAENGGGIFCYNAVPVIEDNVVHGNDAIFFGGGIYGYDHAHMVLIGNRISNNTTGFSGGGIYCGLDSEPRFINNLIVENIATGVSGGGLFCYAAALTVEGNTFAGNTAAVQGGGIFCSSSSDLSMTNSIVWGNSPGEIQGPVTVSYSDVRGGFTGTGNMDADPLFVSGPLGDYYLSQVEAGQDIFRLSFENGGYPPGSPCVDAGDRNVGQMPEGIFVGTTRTDLMRDAGIIDLGFHYPLLKIRTASGWLNESMGPVDREKAGP